MVTRVVARRGHKHALSDLSDVTSAGLTARFVLASDGSAYVGRALVEADISDLGTYLDATDIVSQAEAEAGTATTARAWTAQRVAQAIAALESGAGISNIVEDTTPQLGGNLDMNGFTIASIAEANLLDKTATETVTGAYNFNPSGTTTLSGTTVNISPTGNMNINTVAGSVLITDNVSITGALTATSYGGITEANLLDKSAAETISATWSFDATAKLRLLNTGDAGLPGDTHAFQVGQTAGTNIIIDNNEIMSRNNGGISTLFLNNDGGTVNIGNTVTTALTVSGAITALSYDGVVSANLLDKAAAETITGTWQFDDGLFLLERTNADADKTNYGQIFVKNTTPEELWFASDDGVEHHVAGGSLAETFGKTKATAETVNNSATLQDDDDLAIDVTNGITYAVIMILEIDDFGGTSGDFRFAFSQPSGSVGAYSFHVVTGGQTSFADIGAATSWTTEQTAVPTAPTNAVLTLHGTFTAGADGTLQLRWAQSTAQSSDTRVGAGSSLLLISG